MTFAFTSADLLLFHGVHRFLYPLGFLPNTIICTSSCSYGFGSVMCASIMFLVSYAPTLSVFLDKWMPECKVFLPFFHLCSAQNLSAVCAIQVASLERSKMVLK